MAQLGAVIGFLPVGVHDTPHACCDGVIGVMRLPISNSDSLLPFGRWVGIMLMPFGGGIVNVSIRQVGTLSLLILFVSSEIDDDIYG